MRIKKKGKKKERGQKKSCIERKLPGPPMNLCPEKKIASLYE
jgi:hypothetical protein